MSLDHPLRSCHVGDRFQFDPTLSVNVVGTELFQGPKGILRVTDGGKLRLLESAIELDYWLLAAEDGGVFVLVEDGAAGLLFLLRLVADVPHDGTEPDFIKLPRYSVNTGQREVVYEHYSDPMMAEARHGPDGRTEQLLLRIFVRNIDDTTEEFLWLWLENDRRFQHFVAVIIDPAQIMRA